METVTGLDAKVCYRALSTRDARFDGRFFTAVKTTGVFCRPVCPALTPRAANCEFYPSAASALGAGYRPCLRCRPEISPDSPVWSGTAGTVARALRLIGEGALDEGNLSTLAERLGVGERHLRRLFEQHLGASPVAVAQARRILFAKRLLSDTRLAITDVAFAAGFQSVRRFNDAFRAAYRSSPRELRRQSKMPAPNAAIGIRLPVRLPYDWAGVMRFLAPRAIPGVESATGGCYRRTIRVRGTAGAIEVTPRLEQACLLVRIETAEVGLLREIAERTARVFDTAADPCAIAACLADLDPTPGVRVPGAWDPFELSVRAVLGQQISVAAATTLAGRLVEKFGEECPFAPGRLFPKPEVLAAADLTAIGLTRARGATLVSLAAAVADGRLAFERLHSLPDAVAGLTALPGIGEWTAQYIAMRALNEPDAFPATDLALRKAAGVADLETVSAKWRPWRAYAAMTLWSKLA